MLFFFIFYICFLFIWGNYAPSVWKPNLKYRIGSYGHMHTRLREIKNISNVDILFLGSSHAYRGFDTRIYKNIGLKAFNLGSSGQTPIQTQLLLRRYLNKLNPRLIIYEVYPETFTIDGVESSLDMIANDKNDWYSLEMAMKINNIITYNAFLYGLLRDWFNLNQFFHEPIKKEKDTYISGGFVEREVDYFKSKTFDKKEIQINAQQLTAFSEVIAYLKNKNIRVILVYAPIPPSVYNQYLNNYYFDSMMRQYSEYYNFNEIVHLNDSLHFYDSHHLNQSGVRIFNTKLIEVLFK